MGLFSGLPAIVFYGIATDFSGSPVLVYQIPARQLPITGSLLMDFNKVADAGFWGMNEGEVRRARKNGDNILSLCLKIALSEGAWRLFLSDGLITIHGANEHLPAIQQKIHPLLETLLPNAQFAEGLEPM